MARVSGTLELTTGISETGRAMWRKLTPTSSTPTAPSAADDASLKNAGWSTSTAVVPTAANPYLWGIEQIMYSDGSKKLGPVRSLSVRGEDGEQGKYETGRQLYVRRTQSATAPSFPSTAAEWSLWTTSAIAPTQSLPYLWGFEKVSFNDGDVSYTGIRLIATCGIDANLLDWVKEWDGTKATINGNYVLAGGIYAGSRPDDDNFSSIATGVAIGNNVTKTEDGKFRSGLFAFKGGRCVVAIDPANELIHQTGRFANGEVDFEGKVTGKACVMEDNKIQFYDGSANIVNELIADPISPSTVFPGSITFSGSTLNNSLQYNDQASFHGSKLYKIAYCNTSSTASFRLSVTGKMQTYVNVTQGNVPAVISTRLILAAYQSSVDTGSVGSLSSYIWKKVIGSSSIYSKSATATITNPSAMIGNGSASLKYVLFLEIAIDNSIGTNYSGATMTVKWGNGTSSISDTGLVIQTDVSMYRSTYGANGLILGTSSQNYMAAYKSSTAMLAEMLSNNRGYKVDQFYGFRQYYGGTPMPTPVCLFAGIVSITSWNGNTANGVSIKGKSLGGTNPTVSLNTSSGVTVNWNGCGWAARLGLSSLDMDSLNIQATPYGRNSGGSDKYDTALAVSSYSSNQCRIFTSNDTNYSASSFFIKIEYIL